MLFAAWAAPWFRMCGGEAQTLGKPWNSFQVGRVPVEIDIRTVPQLCEQGSNGFGISTRPRQEHIADSPVMPWPRIPNKLEQCDVCVWHVRADDREDEDVFIRDQIADLADWRLWKIVRL